MNSNECSQLDLCVVWQHELLVMIESFILFLQRKAKKKEKLMDEAKVPEHEGRVCIDLK